MSPAICFNLDQSKILSSGNRLKIKEKYHLFSKRQQCSLSHTLYLCHKLQPFTVMWYGVFFSKQVKQHIHALGLMPG